MRPEFRTLLNFPIKQTPSGRLRSVNALPIWFLYPPPTWQLSGNVVADRAPRCSKHSQRTHQFRGNGQSTLYGCRAPISAYTVAT
jgi:hypothetical protein